uniref:Uncharacterized protein n=1 Tax=Octopus bimaculoides TaxID=37653 RepID=A0A0L8FSB7_OCTBM
MILYGIIIYLYIQAVFFFCFFSFSISYDIILISFLSLRHKIYTTFSPAPMLD